MNEVFESEGEKCQVGETSKHKYRCSRVAEREGWLVGHNHGGISNKEQRWITVCLLWLLTLVFTMTRFNTLGGVPASSRRLGRISLEKAKLLVGLASGSFFHSCLWEC